MNLYTYTSPWYFARSGLVDINADSHDPRHSARALNNSGYFWSKIAPIATITYILDYNASLTIPSHLDERWAGFSVRSL